VPRPEGGRGGPCSTDTRVTRAPAGWPSASPSPSGGPPPRSRPMPAPPPHPHSGWLAPGHSEDRVGVGIGQESGKPLWVTRSGAILTRAIPTGGIPTPREVVRGGYWEVIRVICVRPKVSGGNFLVGGGEDNNRGLTEGFVAEP